MPAPNLVPVLFQQTSHHPAAGKWVLKMKLIDQPHQRKISFGNLVVTST